MALIDIIGHERPLKILRGCIRKGKIPHAFLFSGEEGIGKKLVAINFAKVLNCTGSRNDLFNAISAENGFTEDCCDACSSCIKADKMIHPDIISVVPEGDGRQIVVSSVRSLQEALAYRPFEGIWKIALIDDAESLNPSAANAFLETLEEPPAHSIIILISSRPDMLLTTIRSRCHRIHFSPLPPEPMSRLLEEKLGESDQNRLLLLSTLSCGRVGYAISGDLLKQRDTSFAEFGDLLGTQHKDVWSDRDGMATWFDWNQLWLRDLAVFKATGETDLLINRDKADGIREMSGTAGLRDILELARELNRIRGALRFNLNKQLTLNYTNLLLRKMLGKQEQ